MTGPIVIVPGRLAPRRWLVTGAGGMLGTELAELLAADPSATVDGPVSTAPSTA